MLAISALFFMAATLQTDDMRPLVLQGTCERIDSYERASQSLTTADDMASYVNGQVRKEIDPATSSDPMLKEQAQKMNASLKTSVEKLGTFGQFQLKQTVIRNYFSLADGFAGKSARMIWYEVHGQAKPLYFLASCAEAEPRFVYYAFAHGNFIVDEGLPDLSSIRMPKLYWKMDGDRVHKSNIDSLLREAAQDFEKKNGMSLTLSQGFDLKKLRLSGKARKPEDCSACASGPRVTITLRSLGKDYALKSTRIGD